MGTLIAFYIKADDIDEQLVSHVRQFRPDAEAEFGDGWLGFTLSHDNFDAPEAELARTSLKFKTEVIWLMFQSTVDAFEFMHWKDGKTVRALSYGCRRDERTWERAEGIPENWEKKIIFPKKKLVRALEYTDSLSENEIKDLWEQGTITVGAIIPSLDSRAVAREIAEHYGFPGW